MLFPLADSTHSVGVSSFQDDTTKQSTCVRMEVSQSGDYAAFLFQGKVTQAVRGVRFVCLPDFDCRNNFRFRHMWRTPVTLALGRLRQKGGA